MSRFDAVFGHRSNWTFNPFGRSAQGSGKSEQTSSGDSSNPESDKREDSNQTEHNSKRVAKYKCVTEPFKHTLQLLDELF